MPKVSVIIPYFKGQAYLEECVQSIEEQKIEDLEILLSMIKMVMKCRIP